MKSWKKDFRSSFSGFSLGDLTYKSWNSWKGTSYGRGGGEGKVPEDIKNAYKQASDLITVMNLPFKVELKLTEDDAVNDNTRVIHLPTKIFDQGGVSEEDKVIVSTGLAIHEAQHMRESNLDAIRGTSDPFTRLMASLIEDERIENKLMDERPGFSGHIQKVREYDISDMELLTAWKRIGGIEHGDFFQNLLTMTRCPELMNEEVYEKYKDCYDVIRDIISQPMTSTADSVEGAEKINEIVKDMIINNSENPMPSSDRKTLSRTSLDIFNQRMRVTQGDQDSDNDGYHSGDSISNEIRNDNVKTECKIIQGDSEYGTKTHVTFEKQSGDRDLYLEYKKEVSPYVSAVKKLLTNVDKNYEFSVRGMRSGILDVNKIVEAYQGIPQVYVRKGVVSTNKTRVCILVDESGSMGGNEYDHSRSRIAAQAAVLMKEAFSSIPGIELYIYGHSADEDFDDSGSVNLFVYQEGSTYAPKYSLASIDGRWQNRDHEAIDEVCARVRKFTDDHVIMFVLSDGEPSAFAYGGDAAMRQVKEIVKKREKQGFDIIQVNIGDSLVEEDMKKMFDKYVYVTEGVSEFPKALSRIIKKAISADKSTKVQVL